MVFFFLKKLLENGVAAHIQLSSDLFTGFLTKGRSAAPFPGPGVK